MDKVNSVKFNIRFTIEYNVKTCEDSPEVLIQ